MGLLMLRQRFVKRSILFLTLLLAAASVQALTMNEWRLDSRVDQSDSLTVTDEAESNVLLPSQSATQPTDQFTAVPESETLLLLMSGLLGLSLFGDHRQRR